MRDETQNAHNVPMAQIEGVENVALSSGDFAHEVSFIRASDIAPEPIDWLWRDWLAAGKLHVFGGAPGTGKTTIAMKLAATVSTGGRWPDGTRSTAGNVVIWSGEDDPKDTLVPRLTLSGAGHGAVAPKAARHRKREAFDC